MLPVNFPQSNLTLVKPDNLTDEECGELRALVCEIEGTPCFQVAYKPNKEDLEAITEGRPIYLHMHVGPDHGRWVRISVLQTDTTGTMFCRALTGWLPSQAEARLLKRGANIWITILGTTLAPIHVWTNNKEGEPNE